MYGINLKKSKSSHQLKITYKDEPEIKISLPAASDQKEASPENWRQRIKVFGIDSSMYLNRSEEGDDNS